MVQKALFLVETPVLTEHLLCWEHCGGTEVSVAETPVPLQWKEVTGDKWVILVCQRAARNEVGWRAKVRGRLEGHLGPRRGNWGWLGIREVKVSNLSQEAVECEVPR